MSELHAWVQHSLQCFRKKRKEKKIAFRWLSYMPFVIRKRRILYMSVPKNACTTIKTVLCQIAGKKLASKNIHKLHVGFTLLRKMSETMTILTSPDWFRFCFVRNPYDRLLSAYKNKIAPGTHESAFLNDKKAMRKKYGCRIGSIRFEDFVRYACSTKNKNPHWDLQVHLLKPALVNYQFVGKVETLSDDMSRLLETLDIPMPQVPRLNATKATKLSEVYNQALADMVYEAYKPDFIRYGYDRDSWKV